jgi:hypothetical protein
MYNIQSSQLAHYVADFGYFCLHSSLYEIQLALKFLYCLLHRPTECQ